MVTKRKRLLVGLVAGMVVVAMIAGLVIGIPPTSQQLPPNAAPMMVVVTHPTDESAWPADTPIPVTAMAIGQAAVKSVELWTDGRLFDRQVPPEDTKTRFDSWAWMPLTEGAHAVFVRATDANGRTADSNVVHIQASAAAGFLGVVTTQGGETLLSLGEQNGATAEQMADANPSIDPAGALAPDTQVFIPVQPFSLPPGGEPPVAPPPGGPVVPAEEGVPGGPSFYLEHTFDPNADAPSAPSLSASVGVCNVTLTFQDHSDTEDGFFVYALPETAVSFKRITSLKAHTGDGALEYTVPNQHGHVEFYVSAYSSGGEAPSPPVAVDVTSAQCSPAEGGQGDLQYKAGFLTLPDNVQLAYFYASINGGAWQRIPAGHDFLEPMAGEIDLRTKIQQLLGGQATGEVDLDVWGWSLGELVHLGPIHLNVNLASLAICNLSAGCSGDMGAIHWVPEAVVGSDQTSAVRDLRWTANGADIDYAIWQVSTQPFPPEYSVGAPPGLRISGISEAEVNSDSGVAGGDFTIDFKTDLQFSFEENEEPQAERGWKGFWPKSEFESLWLPALTAEWNRGLAPGPLEALLTQKLYIRVMPMAGGHPASDPSNTVLVTYQPVGEPPPIHIYKVPTYSVEVLPDSFVNEVKVVQQKGILGCSIITGADHDTFVDWYKQTRGGFGKDPDILTSQAEDGYQFYADRIGWTACPGVVEQSEESIPEQFAGGLVEAWNTIASTIEQIKGELVGVIASFIPGCDATCRSVLMTGLNFAITYFTGLPPSMPNFDSAVSMGVDYAVQMAISQAGIPYCDPTCQDLIADGIKSVGSELAKSGKSQPGCMQQKGTLWVYEGSTLLHLKPLCFPPGISYEPLKGSMYERGIVQVRVTRIDGSPELAPQQLLVVDTHAVNAAYGDGHSESTYFQITTKENCTWVKSQGQEVCTPVTNAYYYDMVFNEPLVGTPFPQGTIAVPVLQTGQSVVVPVVFEVAGSDYKPPNVYPPRLAAILSAHPDVDLPTLPVDWWRDFLHMTDSGAEITIAAHVLCQDKATPSIWNSPCSEIGSRQFVAP